jgi:hypothetical protein
VVSVQGLTAVQEKVNVKQLLVKRR